MRWDPTTRGWEAKWRRIDDAHDAMCQGRCRAELGCFDRSMIAVVVQVGRRRHEAGLCQTHHGQLLREMERRGRPQPDGSVILDRVRVGASRLLEPGEVLDGPLVRRELDPE